MGEGRRVATECSRRELSGGSVTTEAGRGGMRARRSAHVAERRGPSATRRGSRRGERLVLGTCLIGFLGLRLTLNIDLKF